MDESGRAAAEAGRVLEESFLSPRVVDAATLAEFAESLGELLRRAAEQREHLRRTVAEGDSVASHLRDATTQATEKLRPAAKLVPNLEQKLHHAEQLIKTAGEAAETLERSALDAAKAASGEGLAAAQASQRAVEQSLARAREVEARLSQLAQRADMAVELLQGECKQRLESAARHSQDVLGTMIAEIDARAEQAIDRLTGLLEERRAAAEAALAEPLTVGTNPGGESTASEEPENSAEAIARSLPMEEIRERLTAEIAAGAREEINELIDSVREQVVQRGRYLDERSKALDERAQRLEARAAEAAELAGAAEARLEAVRRELAQINERGREIASAAGQALSAFDDELALRMHAVREMMEQLASVTGPAPGAGTEAAPAPSIPPGNAPVAAVESKPPREAGFVRIDRPIQGDTSAGLPGRLKF